MNKHDEHCKAIVEDLKKYASGDYFLYDGDLYPLDSEDDFWNKDGYSHYLDDDGYYYYDIAGDKIEESEVDPASLYDYFDMDSIYNIDWVLDSYKEYKAVRVMVACGGPNIYINTWDGVVELFWWSESGKAYLPYNLRDEIDDYFRDYFNC